MTETTAEQTVEERLQLLKRQNTERRQSATTELLEVSETLERQVWTGADGFAYAPAGQSAKKRRALT